MDAVVLNESMSPTHDDDLFTLRCIVMRMLWLAHPVCTDCGGEVAKPTIINGKRTNYPFTPLRKVANTIMYTHH